MRYFIFLSYDGTAYHGWQRQPNATSVQEELESVLRLLMGVQVNVVGAGRTDAGVHARLMAAHINVEESLDCDWLKFKFNCLLPPDIAVYTVVPVTDEAHARFSALSRTYRYHLFLSKDPFRRSYACRYYEPLDFDLMNRAAALLEQHIHFGSFCKTGSDNKTDICHITCARWVNEGFNAWYFEVTADRFLRNMVRALVGTLIQVGLHKMDLPAFEGVIKAGNRCAAGQSMPACGLFLQDIKYSSSIFPNDIIPEIF